MAASRQSHFAKRDLLRGGPDYLKRSRQAGAQNRKQKGRPKAVSLQTDRGGDQAALSDMLRLRLRHEAVKKPSRSGAAFELKLGGG
jgi:hypothetical protein